MSKYEYFDEFPEFARTKRINDRDYVETEVHEEKMKKAYDKINKKGHIIADLQNQMEEMQSHIDCLKDELKEVQSNKQELPDEPIKVADILISATGTYETNPFMRAIHKQEQANYKIYSVSDLRQIAEHLLIYCNNAGDD